MFSSDTGAMVDAAAVPQIGSRTLCQHPGCGKPIELKASKIPGDGPYWAHLERWGGEWHLPTPVEPEQLEPVAAQRMLADFTRTYNGYRDGVEDGRREALTDFATFLMGRAGDGVDEFSVALRQAARWAERRAGGES